jgi:ribosomal protein S18 acetylase RimI-like enzyme
MPDTLPPTLHLATSADAAQIAALVNDAYRPTTFTRGWTHQGELVTGDRTSVQQVCALFGPRSVVLTLRQGNQLLACAHVCDGTHGAYIGMLATRTDAQATGLGSTMLEHAERYAAEKFDALVVRMTVLSGRPELLAYYERRGYVVTGETGPFPTDAGVGTPLVANLRVLGLVKQLISAPLPQCPAIAWHGASPRTISE